MSDGLGDVERVVARDEIRQLAFRYALAVDTRDLDALVALFVPDVRVGRDRRGRAALRESFLESLGAIGVSILFVGNHVVDFDAPDRARGVVYCRGQIQDGERWIEQAIQYRDTYERRDGEWLFVRRRHLLWYGVETAERPLAQPPANWPASHVGIGTVPQDLPGWDAFWREVREREGGAD
ncbi:MAG: nuclear transport factor 2 family protein [Myxococcota bacterium]